MKKALLTLMTGFCILLVSCGHPTLNSKEDAVEFLESHKFLDESAKVSGTAGGSLETSFIIKFSNGNAIIGDETLPYTITEDGSNSHCGGPAYLIKFCGSQKYAYGGCIESTLCSGSLNDGSKTKFGPSLTIDGSYIKAHFSYISKNGITNKN
ncbi:MAG: hypothetical protein V4608_09910 [Bacteroidota bacterium]